MRLRFLHISLFVFFAFLTESFCQTVTIEIPIIPTGAIKEGEAVVLISSDDAEQENDAIDNLYDDDIDAGWEGAPEDQNILTAGLRFQNINIPKGAKIQSAYLRVVSHEAKSASDVARIMIYGDPDGFPETFNETDLISSRQKTNASVLWEVKEDWELWGAYQTPDLKDIIQEIVDGSLWFPGNPIALYLFGENQGSSEVENAREFESFENIADPEDGGDGQNHPERVPRLIITFTVEEGELSIPVVQTGIIFDEDAVISVSSDDAEQENDAIDNLFDDDLDAGWEGAPEDQNILTAGIRFQSVTIPQGSEIIEAYLTVNSHEAKSTVDVANITIAGEASDDAMTFTEDALITARPQTTSQILWEVNQEWGLWTYHNSIDIAPVIQEIVNRSGWVAGNALALLLKGENQGSSEVENAREFESYENISDPEDGGDGQNHPERRPRLYVRFAKPTSVKNDDIKSLNISPMPATQGFVNVLLESNESSEITIYDYLGAAVKSLRNNNESNVAIKLDGLASGFYIVKAIQGNRVYMQKLIIH